MWLIWFEETYNSARSLLPPSPNVDFIKSSVNMYCTLGGLKGTI